MRAYYNENDPFAAAWLRELIKENLIAPGEVDERSICDVKGADLRGFTQVHLFAGIGGWSYALRLAGWSDDRSCWTGSCPCQPFSAAGKQQGSADKRHLWPEMFRLIQERRPERVLGEQVEAAVRLGWLDGVFADMEAESYTCGAAVLGAHSVGAPHIRQRIYWMAERLDDATSPRHNAAFTGAEGKAWDETRLRGPESRCTDGRLADAECDTGDAGWLTDEPREGDGAASAGPRFQPGRRSDLGRLGDTTISRIGALGRQSGQDDGQQIAIGGSNLSGRLADTVPTGRPEWRASAVERPSPWGSGVLIPCADGKARRAEPGIFPLAHGFPNRVGILRGAGNAIVPQAAAEFIRACTPNLSPENGYAPG